MLIAAMVVLVYFLGLIGLLIWRWRQEADIPVEPGPVQPPQEHFIVKPYIQLGTPDQSATESLEILWHTADIDAFWEVETRTGENSNWRWEQQPTMRRLEFAGMAPQRQYKVVVTGLFKGEDFDYRLLKNGEVVFASSARARKSFFEQYRFVVVGDVGSGSEGQKKTAHQFALTKPDFVCVPGDAAYELGRATDYLARFFPVYNAEETSPETGASLMRSTLFVAAPGNHDMGMPYEGDVPDLDKDPDLLAYFIFWSLPLNGPTGTRTGVNDVLKGSDQRKAAFLAAAGNAYPRMTSYSFDYANSHWTVVDTNDYMDLSDQELQAWLERDLSAAAKATWKFVCLHQPGFTTDKGHVHEQRSRLLVDIFQRCGVDMVFSGHAHWYERSYPLSFEIDEAATGGRLSRKQGDVPGTLTLDEDFDGDTKTKPKGIVYITSGAGGGKVKPYRLPQSSAEVQPFTCKYVGDRHSFTVCDVQGSTLTVRQISADGEEVDRFTISK